MTENRNYPPTKTVAAQLDGCAVFTEQNFTRSKMRRSSSALKKGSVSLFLLFNCLFSTIQLSSQCPSGTLSGVAYIDVNSNGILDGNENGQSGILIQIFNEDNSRVAQAISDANGNYQLSQLTDGQQYRVEFSSSEGLATSLLGQDNRSDVQFATIPGCNSSIGLLEPAGSCNAETPIFLSCFVNGLGTNSPSQETLIGMKHGFNASSGVEVYATQAETGSVWGLAYDPNARLLYSAAFVKQHSGLGPDGLGAIYVTDIDSKTTSTFVNLQNLGQNIGALSQNDPSDCSYGRQAGKIGLGGMTIDPSGQYLYVTNLYNNSIVRININDPRQSTTTRFPVPNPGCSDGSYKIFGLNYHNGKVYVTVSCTAENSQDESLTAMHAYSMSPASGNFDLVFSDTYLSGYWDDTKIEAKGKMQWFTDLDFTSNDDMILGISDRIGHSYCNEGSSRIDNQYGDILKARKSGQQWILESNGKAGQDGTGVGNNEGPNGGEFFGDDFFPGSPAAHPEVALGSIFVMPGSDQVVATVFDPLFAAYSGGLHKYDVNTGSKVSAKELYNQNISNYFGKATGFGDVVGGCGYIQPSIGNYVWDDLDCDGLQEAGEPGLSNIEVQLYNDRCQLVSVQLTDDLGYYNFDASLLADNSSTYYVALDSGLYEEELGYYNIGDKSYYPSLNIGDQHLNSDLKINNACQALANIPTVEVTLGNNNNMSFDLGLKASTAFDLALTKVNKSPESIEVGDLVEFEIQVYNQGSVTATSFEIIDYLTSAYTFKAANNPGWVRSGDFVKKMVNQPLLPGTSVKHTIVLGLTGSSNLNDLVNMAELSYTMDSNGDQNSDIDSSVDEDAYNDKGGVVASSTDDVIDDPGILDEDDHDPAMVYVVDLALNNIIRDDRVYDANDQVTFDINICNQGNVAVSGFEVVFQIPEGLIYSASLNSEWNLVNGSIAKLVRTDFLEEGDKTSFPIHFTIGTGLNASSLTTYAEISDFTSTNLAVNTDFDSTPDENFSNDIGSISATNNMLLDNGTIDEDDHDPEEVRLRAIDLALIKKANKHTYNLGDEVEFSIEVHNQGNTVIKKLMLVDYVPSGMSLEDDSWTIKPGAGYAYKEVQFLTGLVPGEIYTDYIKLKISSAGHVGAYINHAEIGEVYDMENVDISSADRDSNADAILGNDSGGQPATAMDDYLLGDGIDDEDDEDPEMIFVPSIEFDTSCICLNNGTDVTDSEFRDYIRVTSLQRENWTVDQSFNFELVSISKIFNADGTAFYTFEGKFVSGNYYSIRVTNGEGVYLQIEGGGCEYTEPQVYGDGLSAVCANSTHTYNVNAKDPAYEDCTKFRWFLEGGGRIVNLPGTSVTGSGSGFVGCGTGIHHSITIDWGDTPGPHTLRLLPECEDACISPVSLEVAVSTADGPMACIHELNVSLDNGCTSIIQPEDLLTSDMPMGVQYQLMLTDAAGNLIQNNRLTSDHLWTTVMAKVIEPCTGNSCWATLNVEDKLAPKIDCDDIEIKCWQMDTYEPIVIDNCTKVDYTLTSESITALPCDSMHLKKVYRTYIAEDEYGNISQPCTQTIRILPMDLDEIAFPESFLLEDDTHLGCEGLVLDENGFPAISMTGVPTISGRPLYPLGDLYCNIGIDYRDILVSDFGCSRKLMRTWTIYDGCQDPIRRVQTIEIGDRRDPWVDCPPSLEISTNGGPGCEAEYTITIPTISDDCTTENFNIDVAYPGGFIQNLSEQTTVNFSTIDSSTVTYTVYDNCGNSSSCEVEVSVSDLVSPTAVCDRNSVVSLRRNGTAKAFASTFDDGSYDDCSLYKLLVKRIDSNCECERPQYDDMHYLGYYNSRHYYISNFRRQGVKAFKYAKAFGASLLTLETELEHDWVYENVNKHFPESDYYIGLAQKGNSTSYTWDNHAEPTFDKWLDGEPTSEGSYVVVNKDGAWVPSDNKQHRFVLEVADPCGFSDEVEFCCADAGAEDHMVVLRAIDYFGQYNDCMVNVQVQDKVPPAIQCPDDIVLDCATPIDLGNLNIYGNATASDSCVVTLKDIVIDSTNQCGLGYLIRRFTAEDASGSSYCDQIISFENDHPFDFDDIDWPDDFETNLGCKFGELDPEFLPEEQAYPRYPTKDICDLVEASFTQQVFSFSGTGSDACLKILRRWTVIDWCQNDADGLPLTRSYDQTIKVNDEEGPEIDSEACAELTIMTSECDSIDVKFKIGAFDECILPEQMRNHLRIDIGADGTIDLEDSMTSDTIRFDHKLPIGHHIAYASFDDLCGNTETCAKEIWIESTKAPSPKCKDGISVGLEPMDLDGDGEPDDEMACIFPYMIDLGAFHACGIEIDTIGFCKEENWDKIVYNCQDIGIDTVTLCVIDIFGNAAECNVRVEIQDNNDGDFCPEFDLALMKTIDVTATAGPFNPGDLVTFNLTVFNQGNQIASDNIELVDYIPTGWTLEDSNWSGTPASRTLTVAGGEIPAGGLLPGESIQTSITLRIDPTTMERCIFNFAEIAGAENPLDYDDLDSDPDSDPDNDLFIGEDLINNEDGDEDDHDGAKVDIVQTYDLALTKDTSMTTPSPYMQGSDVCFDIVVENQGSINANNIEVTDRIPLGLNFQGTDSPGWTFNGSTATANISFLAPGEDTLLTICFEIDELFMGTSLRNFAQITADDNDDEDSDPDVDEDGDEDDEDDEVIMVGQSFDLALVKKIKAGGPAIYETGDVVVFVIQVINQGTVNASNVRITDYVPSGFNYTTSAFNLSNDWGLGPNPTALIGNILAQDTITREIELQIDENFTGASLINNAEITSADNALGLFDEDSTPDDNSGTPSELDTDDDVEDNPDNPNDNDDYDPAEVLVRCVLEPVCDLRDQITVQLDEDGCAVVTPQMIDLGSSATCDGLGVTLTPAEFKLTCDDVGQEVVLTVTVTDDQNNTTSSDDPACKTQVTVLDEVDPEIECEASFTTDLNAQGQPIIVSGEIIISTEDNCEINPPIVFELLEELDPCEGTLASYTVTDESGNTDSCQFMIFIDDQDPIAICKDITVCLSPEGSYTLTPADLLNVTEGSSDPEACADLEIFTSQSIFGCMDAMNSPVMVSFMVVDINGGSDDCISMITVEEKEPPVAICQDIIVELNANGQAFITSSDIDNGSSDLCGLATNPLSIDRDDFDCDDVNTIIEVTLTVTDKFGNSSTCEGDVTVRDNIDPTVECFTLRNFNVDESGVVVIDESFIIVSSDDNCDLTESIDINRFTCDDKGDLVVVTATVTDEAGNSATCTTNVNVRDRIRPSCTLLQDEVFNVIGNPPFVTVEVDDLLSLFTDNCAAAPASANISPSQFDCSDLGEQLVTVVVDDGCGNTASCTADIVIQDVTEPTCEVEEEVEICLDEDGEYTLTPADINISSTAGCDENAMLEVTPNFFSCNSISLNPTCVVLTVTASNGNTATCKSNITVVDKTAPVIDCDDAISVSLNANGVASITVNDIVTSSSDACGVDSQVIDISSFDCEDKLSPVLVTATVTDSNNNTSTCTSEITVVDESAPSCTLLEGQNFNLVGTPPMVTISPADLIASFDDNCADASANSTIEPSTFDCNSIGEQMVTVTVEDDCDNTATCTTTINIGDTSEPTCISQDITVVLDDDGEYTLDPTEIDNGSNAGCGTNVLLEVDPSTLNCDDLGETEVVLTVTTTGGNSSTCTAIVTVEDETPPVITCPDDLTLDCGTDISNLLVFGNATGEDVCGDVVIGLQGQTINVNACNVGVITRTFTATDESNNVSTCTQVIEITPPNPPFSELNITWPMSPITVECIPDSLNIDSGMPMIDLTGIDCVAVGISSVTIDPTPGMGTGCDNMLERTWTVVDSCQLDGMGGGEFTFVQTIILDDSMGPVLTCPDDVTVYLEEDFTQCFDFVDLPATAMDCSGVDTFVNDSDSAFNNNSGNAAGDYPGGVSEVTLTATDICGNSSTCDYTVAVLDTFATLSSCKKIIETIQAGNPPSGTVTIDQACAEIDSECPNSAFFLSFSNSDNMVTSFQVFCSDVAAGLQDYTVYLWSGDQLLDSCTNILQVLDGAGHCTQPFNEGILGRIKTEDNKMIPDVTVELDYSEKEDYLTLQDGYYAFTELTNGNSYVIRPEKDMNYLNGVSTRDLIHIQRHILGIEKLDSPYKIIAADINRSDDVNGLDMVELRKLILGAYTTLPENTSWRMVDATHIFPDPSNPFMTFIPETYSIRSLQSVMEVDFIGVKIGDVNNSSIMELKDVSIAKRNLETKNIELSINKMENTAYVDINISVPELNELIGMQWELQLDLSQFEILEVVSLNETFAENNYYLNQDSGTLNVSWNVTAPRKFESSNLFKLVVVAKDQEVNLEAVTLTQNFMAAEAYDVDETFDLSLVTKGAESMGEEFVVMQNTPNPWKYNTEIEFYLPVDKTVDFNVYNTNGQLVFRKSIDGSKGYNKIRLSKEDLSSHGIYYYELVSDQAKSTHKMILLD